MKKKYKSPLITLIYIKSEGGLTATSIIVLPGDSNNLVEVEDWDNQQELHDSITW